MHWEHNRVCAAFGINSHVTTCLFLNPQVKMTYFTYLCWTAERTDAQYGLKKHLRYASSSIKTYDRNFSYDMVYNSSCIVRITCRIMSVSWFIRTEMLTWSNIKKKTHICLFWHICGFWWNRVFDFHSSCTNMYAILNQNQFDSFDSFGLGWFHAANN